MYGLRGQVQGAIRAEHVGVPCGLSVGSWVWLSSIGGVSVKKMDVIKSGVSELRAVWVKGSLVEVDLDKVSAGVGGNRCGRFCGGNSGVREAEFVKAIGTMTKQFCNFIGVLGMVQKLRDMIDVCITLDLDMDHHDIMEGEEVLGMGFIHPFPVVSAAFISEVPEDGGCKGGISLSEAKEAVDGSNVAINGVAGLVEV